MHRLFTAALCAATLLLPACGADESALLIGTWEAVDVREGGDSLALDPAEIGFAFSFDDRYSFRSTVGYTEAGIYRYDNGYLYAKDTTGNAEQNAVVAVELLTGDSLVLRMPGERGERRVVLLKQ